MTTPDPATYEHDVAALIASLKTPPATDSDEAQLRKRATELTHGMVYALATPGVQHGAFTAQLSMLLDLDEFNAGALIAAETMLGLPVRWPPQVSLTMPPVPDDEPIGNWVEITNTLFDWILGMSAADPARVERGHELLRTAGAAARALTVLAFHTASGLIELGDRPEVCDWLENTGELAFYAYMEASRPDPAPADPPPAPGVVLPQAGQRVVDGGDPGTLTRCPECGGTGLLFVPDQPPQPGPAPEAPANESPTP